MGPLTVATTLSIPNIRNTFLIMSCTPFGPQNSLNWSGHGLFKVSKAFHRDSRPCWLQCFPQLSSWLYVFWVVLDTHRKLLSLRNPVMLQFLTHSNWCAWYLQALNPCVGFMFLLFTQCSLCRWTHNIIGFLKQYSHNNLCKNTYC